MSASFWVFKNGAISAISNTFANAKRTSLAHGNPAGDGGGAGKFETKVRNTGPVSSGGSSTGS